ncbi:MAG TPA: 6-phosphogluconolactonase [Steroidobacteraceae bacterium]|nr:6-phosphogluconolactonase [Gammaproteobacteria bacterium]HEV2284710.1 6-phosphogluconolactonase [Steroidobacteraceae bacterium]
MTELAVSVFDSRAELDAALTARLALALAAPGARAVMLAGGTTPMNAYRALARQGTRRDERLHLLFSDERYVPADSPASNYHQSQPLLTALALPEEEVLRVRTELPLEEAAADYAGRLTTLLSSGIHVGLGLLGLGADGHTASLFSAADLERGRGRYALAVQRPDGMSAVSVSPEFLATVEEPLFVVAGADKRDAVRALLAHSAALTAWRAVSGCARVELWADRLATPTLA